MADVTALLDRMAASPRPFIAVQTYADGRRVCLPCHSRAAADNAAEHMSRKVGRQLIDRATGATVCVVSVDVIDNPRPAAIIAPFDLAADETL